MAIIKILLIVILIFIIVIVEYRTNKRIEIKERGKNEKNSKF